MVESLGTINYSNQEGYQKAYSERTGKMIDVEVRKIIDQQYRECKALILEHKDKLELLAERLLEKETIALPDIVEILGPRPFPLKTSLLEYLEELKERINEDEKEAADKKVEEETDQVPSEAAEEDCSIEKSSEDKEQKDK